MSRKKEYYLTHKEQIARRKKKYRALHVVQQRQCDAAYYRDHQKQICSRKKKYRKSHRAELAQANRKYRMGRIPWLLLHRVKARAKRLGLAFNLTLADLVPLPTCCPVLGLPLRYGTSSNDPCAYSLDRIDNSLGYVQGNIAVMSNRANRLKNDGTLEEHQRIVTWMKRKRGECGKSKE